VWMPASNRPNRVNTTSSFFFMMRFPRRVGGGSELHTEADEVLPAIDVVGACMGGAGRAADLRRRLVECVVDAGAEREGVAQLPVPEDVDIAVGIDAGRGRMGIGHLRGVLLLADVALAQADTEGRMRVAQMADRLPLRHVADRRGVVIV